MDPNACLSTLLENLVDGDWSDAAENAESLQSWVQRGGCDPIIGKLRQVSLDAFLDWVINHPERGDRDAC